MGKVDNLPGLQVLYAIYGYNLNWTKKKLTRMILALILFSLLSFSTINSIVTTYFMLTKSNGTMFYNLVQVQGNWSYWIFFHYFLLRKSKIITLIGLLSNYLSIKDKKLSCKLSYLSLLTFISPINRMIWIGFSYNQAVGYYSQSYGLNESKETTMLIVISHQIPSQICITWSQLTVSLYLLVLLLMHMAKKNLLKLISSNLIKSCADQVNQERVSSNDPMTTVSMVSILTNFDTIFSIHNQFDSVLNFFPFLVISDLFFAYSRVMYVVRSFSATSLITFLIVDTVNVLSLIVIINHFNNDLDNMINKIRESVNKSFAIDLVSKSVTVNNLDKCSNLKLTGFKLFNLEPSLILSFTSALVTFTILFLG